MRRLRTTPLHQLGLVAALVVALVIGGVGIAQAVGGGGTPPAQAARPGALRRARARPQPQGITARIHFSNNLLPSGSLPQGSSSPLITGADGRLWLTNDGRLRLELQSDAGDAQIVVRRQALQRLRRHLQHRLHRLRSPQQQQQHDGQARADARVRSAARSPTSAGCGTCPARRRRTPPGSPSYTVRISPKDDGGLLGAGEVAWDAARGVPLRAAVYAQGQKSPVLELEATDISYGPVSASDVAVKPPAGAKKVEISPPVGRDRHGNPASVRGLAAVQRQVGFPLAAPATLAGLPRREVSLVRFGVRRRRGGDLRPGPRRDRRAPAQVRRAGHAPMSRGDLRLPQINIDGATGSELATALGTIVTFERDGVSYTVAGSVPPLAAENAARGLR